MKIIINRSFINIFARIIVYRNQQKMNSISIRGDGCELHVREGDQVEVRLKSLCLWSSTIASFVYHEGNDSYYVSPTMVCKIWELASFKILPYFSLLFLVLRASIVSETYEWFCTYMVVLTALSLMGLQICMQIPYMRKELFSLDVF